MSNIIALGTGSAFTLKNYQTNFLIQRKGKCLLIDCGGDIRFSLKNLQISVDDIDSVYVSHLHQDHIGGLEYLGFIRYFKKIGMEKNGQTPIPLPKLFCEGNLSRELWSHSLSGGMSCLEGIDANLNTFFDLRPVQKNSYFIWEGIQFNIVQSVHVSSKYSLVDSFGLMFTDDYGVRIFITTDCQFAPETSMKTYYKEANLIIHDCETGYMSGVHSHYNQLITLSDEVKEKIILTHYQDNVLDDFDTWQQRAKTDGFLGFAKIGCIKGNAF